MGHRVYGAISVIGKTGEEIRGVYKGESAPVIHQDRIGDGGHAVDCGVFFLVLNQQVKILVDGFYFGVAEFLEHFLLHPHRGSSVPGAVIPARYHAPDRKGIHMAVFFFHPFPGVGIVLFQPWGVFFD